MAHIDFKDWTRKTASAKILHDKAFSIAKNSKYDGYQRGLASMPCKTNFLVVQIKMKKNIKCRFGWRTTQTNY